MTAAFKRLCAVIGSRQSPAEVEHFLSEVLTPGEIHDLGLRWKLLELLARGMPQRAIARQLGVSLCKITRGARILKPTRSVVSEILQKEG